MWFDSLYMLVLEVVLIHSLPLTLTQIQFWDPARIDQKLRDFLDIGRLPFSTIAFFSTGHATISIFGSAQMVVPLLPDQKAT